MIQARELELAFGDQIIFDDLSFTLQNNQRIGLVGRNGSGKSTLLKIMAHQQEADSGVVSIGKGTKVAYMPQEVVLASSLSILDETLSVWRDLLHWQQEIDQLTPRMQNQPTAEEIDRYARAYDALGELDIDIIRVKAQTMLLGLGFTQQQLTNSVATLSTGWKMRIVLAKLLLQDADFYLFDEPTNHLDLIAKEWFLKFLKTAPFGFMLVCHEQYIMDEVCTHILELEYGKGTVYAGNYTRYEQQKEHTLALLHSARQLQQKDIARKQEWIARNKAKASKAKQAQSMARQLDSIERITLPPTSKVASFNFPSVQLSGRSVLTVNDVRHQFDGHTIFQHVSFEIERNQKVALIAPNGGGKTTLFNIISGKIPLQHGTITLGYNVTSAIFAQDQTRALDLDRSVLDNVYHACPKADEQVVRTFLGSFLFSGDDVQKKVRVLSGGEKNRVGMVCTLLQRANFLLLDEPTNHLDIPSKHVLLSALQAYNGTLFFVSHDRDFINNLATHIIELTHDGVRVYHGNYDVYRMHVEHAEHQDNHVDSEYRQDKKVQQPSDQGVNEYALNKRARTLERTIERLENELNRVQTGFAECTYGTPEFKRLEYEGTNLRKKLQTAHQELDALLTKVQ